jgi:beta-aspartyl-peptidase (threonine type)
MFSIAVHGGAWDIPDDLVSRHLDGVAHALDVGRGILKRGGSAVEAVEAAVVEMENDDVFDAGVGSFLNAAGTIELDASIMDGKTLRAGAVAAVTHIRNPVMLARRIMEESDHVMLVGAGAVRFARQHGVELCAPDSLIVPRELERWRELQQRKRYSVRDTFRRKKVPSDSVGAVAFDRNGNLAAATSTGGIPGKHPGRVGDSPLIGCGTYADNEAGAASVSGWGESMIRIVMAKSVVDMLSVTRGEADVAADRGITRLKSRVNGLGGVVVMNRDGKVGMAYNTPRMARGFFTSGMKSPSVMI